MPYDLEEPDLEFVFDSLPVIGRIGATVVRRTGWWSPAVQHREGPVEALERRVAWTGEHRSLFA